MSFPLKSILTVCVVLLAGLTARAVTVTNLGTPTISFPVGGLAPFTADYNSDGTSDSLQDMTCRFQFTTPNSFSAGGYVVFESGDYHNGISLLLMNDRLVLTAGGDSSSTGTVGKHALQVFTKPMQPGHQYDVIFGIRLDDNRDSAASDSRAAVYIDGQYAVDPAFGGTHTTSDIRVSNVAQWSGSLAGGYGMASNSCLYIIEGSAPLNFPGANFISSSGSLDSPLQFFANTFYDAVPAFQGPNILMIVADDLNYTTVGSFGGPQPTVTPNIDKLASQGMRFTRHHVVCGVCQPSREALMTGLYPHNNGGEGFNPINRQVTTLAEILDNLDYRLGILSKTDHLQPGSEFPWDMLLTETSLAQGRNSGYYYTNSKTFMQQAIAAGRPFFLMANSNDPHRPFSGSADETSMWSSSIRATFAAPSHIYATNEISVPGFLPDLPNVRKEMAQYYSSARRFDDTLGRVLDALNEVGASNNTIVLFLSDNGIAMPFAKANDYLHSNHSPLVIRWPRVVAPGRVDTNNFILSIDLMPTLLEAIGVPTTIRFDGASILSLLQGGTYQPNRDHAITVFHETSAGVRYEMRGVCGYRYGYIYNPWSDGTKVYSSESQDGLTWNAMVAAAPSDTNIQARVNLFKYRVVEELYDYAQDPDAIYDLIHKPEMSPYIYTARQNLLAWMIQIQDPMLAGFQSYIAAHPVDAATFTSPRLLSAARGDNPGQINLQYPTSSNMLYQIRTSIDLTNWQPFGTPLQGTGTNSNWSLPASPTPAGFYSLDEYFNLNRF
ncbi:MAG: sulfatase family protein [Limisphaerales bacterium]